MTTAEEENIDWCPLPYCGVGCTKHVHLSESIILGNTDVSRDFGKNKWTVHRHTKVMSGWSNPLGDQLAGVTEEEAEKYVLVLLRVWRA